MKKLRYLLWKILGINYYNYLNSKQNINLKDSSFAKVGNKTYDMEPMFGVGLLILI